MAKLENNDFLKLKTIGRKDRISKVDLEKINLVLNKNVLTEIELNSLLADSLITQNIYISDLLFTKFSDVSCVFIQNQFRMYCLMSEIEIVEYILSKGFVIDPEYYSSIMQSKSKLTNEIIELIDQNVHFAKIRKIVKKIKGQ